MAYISDMQCSECKEIKRQVITGDSMCSDCRRKTASKQRRMHLGSLSALTVEERIRRIEEQLYDLNTDVRLNRLEANNARYC